jgi:hypothetical protein
VVGIYVCPSDARARANPQPDNTWEGVTHYLGVSGKGYGTNDGLFYLDSRVHYRRHVSNHCDRRAAAQRGSAIRVVVCRRRAAGRRRRG